MVTRTESLTDEPCALIEPLMPSAPGVDRLFLDHRMVLEGIICRYRTAIA